MTDAQDQYAVLIDAGSSGSRVHVYHWRVAMDPSKRHETKIKPANGWTTKNIGPGIAKLAPQVAPTKDYDIDSPAYFSEQVPQDSSAKLAADTFDRVKEYLSPLIKHALSFIPPHKVAETPLFALATGGMRRIQVAQHEAYDILCGAIKKYLSGTPFREATFSTITGEDEGLYGWVAANYRDDCFTPSETPHGFMELGGESAQFAVSLTGVESGLYKGPLRMVTIWGQQYAVYVKTWMGVGMDSAWKRHLEKLRLSDSAMPLDPCLPRGYSFRLPGSDKIVVGTGNFVECMKEALSLMGCSDKRCERGDLCVYRCAKNGQEGRPESVGCLLQDPETNNPILCFDKKKFSGASVYWHATHGVFGGSSTGKGDDFEQFWNTVVQYSKEDWETLKQVLPREKATDYKYLRRAFFTAALVMSTLFLGFGIPMPKVAIETTRSFANDRAKYAGIAANVAEEDAEKESGNKNAALIRSFMIAEEAHRKERVAEKMANEEEVTAERSGIKDHEFEELGRIFMGVQSQPNREDFMEAVPYRMRDAYYVCQKATRKTNKARKEAGDAAKQAYGKLIDAKHNKREAEKLVKRLNSDNVDDILLEMYNRQGQSKYSSFKDADWTLGRIVLYVTGCIPETRTMFGWKGKKLHGGKGLGGEGPDSGDAFDEED